MLQLFQPCDTSTLMRRRRDLEVVWWIRAIQAEILRICRSWVRSLEVLSGRGYPPRPGDKSISTQWLSRCLKKHGILNHHGSVATVELRALDGNRGLVGSIARLHITYNEGSTHGPSTLILKMTSPGIHQRYSVMRSGLSREASLYETVGSHKPVPQPGYPPVPGTITTAAEKAGGMSLIPGLLPQALHTHSSLLMGECVLLMKDLSAAGGTTGNRLFGDQIWGSSSRPPHLPPPVLALEAVFLTAADMHARHWRDPWLLQPAQGWLKASRWYRGQGRSEWELAIRRARLSWEAVKVRFGGSESPGVGGEGSGVGDKPTSIPGLFTLSEKLVRIVDESFARASWAGLQKHLGDPLVPWTLCHGDFHAANMFLFGDSLDAGVGEEGGQGATTHHHSEQSASSATAGAKPAASMGRQGGHPRVALFDWAEVGPWEPMTDLGQMVISDISPALFQEHARRMVELYWERLVGGGVDPGAYPLEQCWDDFCRGGVERWIWVFSVLAVFPRVPEGLVKYFHDQLLAFIQAFGGGRTYYQLKPVVLLT
ncbi:unnamed protein product [Discosporangium mesarthrocarpum]